MSRLLRFALASGPRASAGAAVASLVAGAMSALLVSLVHAGLAPEGRTVATGVMFAGACAALLVARFVAQALLVRLAHDAIVALRIQLCERILATPVPTLERVGVGRLTAVLTDDVGALAQALPALPQIATGAAIVTGALVWLGALSPVLLGATLLVGVVGVVGYVLPAIRAQGDFDAARGEQGRVHGQLRGVTEGAKDLQLRSGLRAAVIAELGVTLGRWRAAGLRGALTFVAAESWGSTLYLAGVGVLVFVLPRWMTLDEMVLSGFTLGILFVQAPLETALSWAPALGRAEVALAAIEGLELATAGARPAVAARPWRVLAIERGEYQHAETGFRLGPVDLQIASGEVVFLVGGNGSGKTTLAKVVLGLYPLSGGALTVDGAVVTDLDAHREGFGAIFADSFLFEHVPPGDAGPHLATLGLTGLVSVGNGRLSTTALSAGQRRRLLLLSAWLEDRPALVLDEWAADQDPTFRELFYRSFLPAMKARGTTVLVISHDDRYFDAADRIVRMEEGRVV